MQPCLIRGRRRSNAYVRCCGRSRVDFDHPERPILSHLGPGLNFDYEPPREVPVREIPFVDPESKLPFSFVEAVGIGPMFVRRHDFEALGGFDLQLSGPGEPGIWLDYELCLRAWLAGRHVGLYTSDAFERNVGGQGTTMFNGSKRWDNFDKNLVHVRRTHADRIGLVRSTIDDLNQGLVGRPDVPGAS